MWRFAGLIVASSVVTLLAFAQGCECRAVESPPAAELPEAVPCPPRGIVIAANVFNVVDGDTVDVRVQFEFRVRLMDCWAPETRLGTATDADAKLRGLAAKGYMMELAGGQPVFVAIPGTSNLAEVLSLDRVVGRVYRIGSDGKPHDVDLSHQMIKAGHAFRRKPEKVEPKQ